jgi:hypothetical protein
VAAAIGDLIVPVPRFAHELQDQLEYILIAALVAGADQVRLAHPAFLEHQMDGGVVIVDMGPLAHVHTCAVEARLAADQDVGDLPRDHLLDVLVRAVVVGAIGESGCDIERADPGAHEVVGAGFCRRVRAGRIVRGVFVELAGLVEGEIAEDFVGGDVVIAPAVAADGFEQRVRADDIGVDERPWIAQRIVVVRFGGEVDDDIGVGVRDEAFRPDPDRRYRL